MKTGLCSITFRKLTPVEVVGLVKDAGLDAIEWGGDIHVPHGDTAAAEEARQLTVAAGLAVSSYGSYYFVIDGQGKRQDFTPVLESAIALGTDTIRIWPGARPSENVSSDDRKQFIGKLREDLDAAAAKGVRLALEFHVNSLCDSNAAALALLREVDHSNLYIYWQPIYWLADTDYRLEGLKNLAGRVLNVHVFHWLFHPMRGGWAENVERLSLVAGESDWKKYLSVELPEGPHYALMEFVADDDPDCFKADAAVLRRLIQQVNGAPVK